MGVKIGTAIAFIYSDECSRHRAGYNRKGINLRAERLRTMENKKNRMGKVRKTPGQAKPEPRQEPRPSQPKPNQSNATDERPCY